MSAPEEINWERLDKKKLFIWGAGIFSGVRHTAVNLWRLDGPRAFYKGFGTVVVGALPARLVYMSVLEITKSALYSTAHRLQISDIAAAGSINFIAGGTASVFSQLVFLPVDVVSQRLMVLNSDKCKDGVRMNGFSMARKIVRAEGIRGLWRGSYASFMTYVPNSALWWASYGTWQRVLWHQVDFWRADNHGATHSIAQASMEDKATSVVMEKKAQESSLRSRLSYEVITVQTSSALLAGATSACVTTPLDVIKTRLQLTKLEDGKRPTYFGTVRDIVQQDGIKGFTRGMIPRIANVAMWGTCMVSAYEFLKRLAVRDD